MLAFFVTNRLRLLKKPSFTLKTGQRDAYFVSFLTFNLRAKENCYILLILKDVYRKIIRQIYSV